MAQPGKPTAAKTSAAAKPTPGAAQPAAAAAKPQPQGEVAVKAAAPKAAPVGGPERARMISEAAYFIAQKRGGSGNALADWLAAEKQIDQQLAQRR